MRSTVSSHARSPAAGMVEIHEMKMEDNVMRMRDTATVLIFAGVRRYYAPA